MYIDTYLVNKIYPQTVEGTFSELEYNTEELIQAKEICNNISNPWVIERLHNSFTQDFKRKEKYWKEVVLMR